MAAQPFEVHSPSHSQCSTALFCTTPVNCTVPVCSAHGIVMWRAVSDPWGDQVIYLCKYRNYFKALTISGIHFCRPHSHIVFWNTCVNKRITLLLSHMYNSNMFRLYTCSHHQAGYKTLNYALKVPSYSLSEQNCFYKSLKPFIIHTFYINLLQTSHTFMHFYMFLFNCILM